MARTILRLHDVADRTGIPLATLRWYRHRGLGPRTWKLGGRVVAYSDDVDEWLEQHAAESTGGNDVA